MAMSLGWHSLRDSVDRFAPLESSRRRFLQLIAIVLLLQGISIVLLSSKWGPQFGLISIAIGVVILLLAPPKPAETAESRGSSQVQVESEALGVRIVDGLHRDFVGDYGFILGGAMVILAVVFYNSFYSNRPEYGDIDTLAVIFGLMVLVYPMIPRKYRIEAIFSVLFLALVVLILVIPSALISLGGTGDSSISNWYVHYLLAAPLTATLNLIGISASSSGELVTFAFSDGIPRTVGISTACSGLYSMSIFLSAFLAFVLTFERLSPKLMTMVLALGVVTAYLGNLFRMTVICVVGYYNGMDALLWAHKNVGWMVFLSWSAVFWYLVIRFADRRSGAKAIPPEPDPT